MLALCNGLVWPPEGYDALVLGAVERLTRALSLAIEFKVQILAC